MAITDLEMNELLVSIASKRERDIALAVFSIEGILREIISLIAAHPHKLQEIGGPIRAVERVTSASDSDNPDRADSHVFNVEVCVNPETVNQTTEEQLIDSENCNEETQTTTHQIVNQLESEENVINESNVGEILIDQSHVTQAHISQSDVSEGVPQHITEHLIDTGRLEDITIDQEGSDLGTEVTTITTSDGQNVQVVIKSVERRAHHQTTLTSAIPSADVNSVRSVTTSDGTNLYACPRCDKVFMRAFELQRHITVRHTNEKKFVCDVCGQRFALKLYLNNHVRNKHQPDTEKPYGCPNCSYRCAMKSMLSRHMEKHTNVDKYQCNTCEQKFYSTKLLEQHMYTHQEKTLSCDACDYRTANPSKLKYHMKIHDPPTEFQCSSCDYKTNIKADLFRHMTKMHGTKDFQCDQCDLSFKTLSNLNRHQYVHAEKNLVCQNCGWKTADPYEFKRHEREHVQGKKHICDVCGYAFIRAFDLKKHKLTHSKVLNCKFCPAVFSNAHELLCHRRRRHPKSKMSDQNMHLVVLSQQGEGENSQYLEQTADHTDMETMDHLAGDDQNIHEQVIEGDDDERVITVPEGEDHERVITVPEGQTTVIVNEDGDEIIFNPGVSIDSGSGYITVNVPDSSDQTLLEMASAIIAQVDDTNS